MKFVKRAGTAGLMAAALALCSGAASAAPAMGSPAQNPAISQDAGSVLLVKNGGGDRWIGGSGGRGGNVGRSGRSSGGNWNGGSSGRWKGGSASGGNKGQHVGGGDWDRRGRGRGRGRGFYDYGYSPGAYFGLGVAGAVLDGALDDEDYGYDEGPAYTGSSALRRCAARFRSFEWDTGRYTTYGGDRRLCPYLR